MNKTISFFLIILISTSLVSGSRKSEHWIDWKEGKIYSTGVSSAGISRKGMPVDNISGERVSLNRSRMNAYNKARENAVENLFRQIMKIRVDGENTFEDIISRHEEARSRIYDIVYEKAKTKEYPSGFDSSSCSIELKIGDIIPAIPYKYPSDRLPERTDVPIKTKYSGVVIDARGLDVEPMLFPAVINEYGLEIYGRHLVDIKHAVKSGIVSYVYNEEDASKSRNAGERPYYCVALKSIDGSPVISDSDAKKIYSSPETLKELKKCRVIFIIDRNKIR